MICRICGSDKIVKAGKQITRKGIYQRYLCTNCGHIMKGELLRPPITEEGIIE